MIFTLKKKNSKTEAKSLTKSLFMGLNLLIYGYFIIRLIFFATHISHDVPPDETAHFGICQVHSHYLLLPENSESTYSLGLITNIPYLYYYIMGKFLKLNIFPIPDLIFLRLLNCAITISTVFVGHKWIQLVSSNRICHLLFLVLLTNTSMFSFLGASVNYDTLTILFAAMTVYYFHLFCRKATPQNMFLFAIALLSGSLTKISFLPLVPILLLIYIFRFRGNLGIIFTPLKRNIMAIKSKELILLSLFLCLLVLNLSLYLGNLIKYGRIVPSSLQVLTKEQAMQYRITARDMILGMYKSNQLSFDEGIKKAKQIKNKSDRANAIYLLNLARENRRNPQPLIDRVRFTSIWIRLMLQRIFGIMGHIWMLKSSYEFAFYQLIVLFAAISFIRCWKASDANGILTDASFLFLIYAGVLAHYVNYPSYCATLSVGAALQGRYFFPVLIPFYGVGAYYLTEPFKKKFQLVIFLIITAYLIWGDFPYFLKNATADWYFSH